LRPGSKEKRPGKDYLLSPMRKADLTVLDEVLDGWQRPFGGL
jgi:hypothetical protein